MRRRAVRLVLLLLVTWWGGSAAARAQEGHPLTGTWSGDWGPSPTERHHITLVLRWDGTTITGLINPGLDGVQIGRVSLDVADWTVRLEAEGKDASGAPVPISAEGRLDDLGSYHRTLSGTWREGRVAGDFKLTRD